MAILGKKSFAVEWVLVKIVVKLYLFIAWSIAWLNVSAYGTLNAGCLMYIIFWTYS